MGKYFIIQCTSMSDADIINSLHVFILFISSSFRFLISSLDSYFCPDKRGHIGTYIFVMNYQMK